MSDEIDDEDDYPEYESEILAWDDYPKFEEIESDGNSTLLVALVDDEASREEILQLKEILEKKGFETKDLMNEEGDEALKISIKNKEIAILFKLENCIAARLSNSKESKKIREIIEKERAGLFGLSKEDLMHDQCNDYNFEELMKGNSDIFPDFKFKSFYELLKNKIPLDLQDWNKQRDEFIKNLEDMIESEYSDSPPNFDREYDYLQKGQKMHDDGNFEEAILNCYKAVEEILGKIHPKTASSKFYYKVI